MSNNAAVVIPLFVSDIIDMVSGPTPNLTNDIMAYYSVSAGADRRMRLQDFLAAFNIPLNANAATVYAGPVAGSSAAPPSFRNMSLGDFGTQNQNRVAVGPTSGTGAAAFRLLVGGDVPVMLGDFGSGGTQGAVPAPPIGSTVAGLFLRADATFALPPKTMYAVMQEQQASGTSSTFTVNATTATRILNTKVSDLNNILSSFNAGGNNQFIPIAGTYVTRAWAMLGNGGGAAKIKVRNVTAAVDAVQGLSGHGGAAATGELANFLDGVFTANGTDSYALQQYSQNSNAGGTAVSQGQEIYASITLEKIA